MATLAELLEQHAGASHEKQLALVDLIGTLSWDLDVKSGIIRFGDKYAVSAQILGTEADDLNTWLWSWANEASDIPPAVTRWATAMRELGEREQIPELTTPEISRTHIDGTRLALVAAGILQAAGYYRGPFAGGAVFVLLDMPIPTPQTPMPAVRIINTFTEVISNLPLNHRRAFLGYMAYKQGVVAAKGRELAVQLPSGEQIQAQFDEQDRLTNIRTIAGQA